MVTRTSNKFKVYVENGDDATRAMFSGTGDFECTYSIEAADIICFTGGADVMPHFFGQQPITGCYYDPGRDARCRALYMQGKAAGKFMVGICRGAQFLNVMNDGWLWQNINNHGKAHMMYDLTGRKEWGMMTTTSTHHQAMRPSPSGIIIAEAFESDEQTDQFLRLQGKATHNDVEVVFYPLTGCLCFQGHPEHKTEDGKETREYFFATLLDCIMDEDSIKPLGKEGEACVV